MPLDSFDLAILAILQRDNRTPLRVIGEAVHLSTPAVQRRIRRMETEGVIAANVARLDAAAVARPLTILVEVELADEKMAIVDEVIERLTNTPQVQQCYYVTGAMDIIMVMNVATMEEYEALTRALFLTDDNIRKFRTSVAIRSAKVGFEVPLTLSPGTARGAA